MEREQVVEIFRRSGALLEGHFLLTSGLHSNRYFQCAKVLQYPAHCEALCADIAARFTDARVDAVIAPALGGIVVGQEVGRQLRARTMFAERSNGVMQLRRGFVFHPGERVVVCEDVVTTGGSVGEVIGIVRDAGATVVGIGYIVDRSGGAVSFEVDPGCVRHAVMTLDVVTYRPESCPLCAAGTPAVKPGSRGSA
jgi:orotate phosphoribosyltransferase